MVGSATDRQRLETVALVDLNRYTGLWFEIARYPNSFERECVRNVTARYAMRRDGKIAVENACIAPEGKQKRSTGWAKAIDGTCARLKVTFFWPFFGDYWILDLGPGYDYAVVGEPGRKYLWILSRTPHMEEALYERIASRMPDKGYDPSRLRRTRQGE